MKTHTIKTPTAELLIIELPENIERLELEIQLKKNQLEKIKSHQ